MRQFDISKKLSPDQLTKFHKLLSDQRSILIKIFKEHPKTLKEGLIIDFLNGKIEEKDFLKDLIQFKKDFNLTDEDIEDLSKTKDYFLNLVNKVVDVDKIKMLIVEDEEQNLKHAQAFINEKKKKNIPIEVDYARDLKEAINKVNSTNYDCIVSDVFFPSNMENDAELRKNLFDKMVSKMPSSYQPGAVKKYTEAMQLWRDNKELAPMGLYFRDYIEEKNLKIGFVFCTSLGHHSIQLEALAKEFYRTEYVEENPFDKGKKDWEKAYSLVIMRIIAIRNNLLKPQHSLFIKEQLMMDLQDVLEEEQEKFDEYNEKLIEMLYKFEVTRVDSRGQRSDKFFVF